jgi:hypothetical protein
MGDPCHRELARDAPGRVVVISVFPFVPYLMVDDTRTYHIAMRNERRARPVMVRRAPRELRPKTDPSGAGSGEPTP